MRSRRELPTSRYTGYLRYFLHRIRTWNGKYGKQCGDLDIGAELHGRIRVDFNRRKLVHDPDGDFIHDFDNGSADWNANGRNVLNAVGMSRQPSHDLRNGKRRNAMPNKCAAYASYGRGVRFNG